MSYFCLLRKINFLSHSNRLTLGNIGYLEEVKVPDYLKLDSLTGPTRKIVLTSALELDDNVYSINAKAISACSWNSSCSCESTIVASPIDSVKSPPVDVEDRVFTFTLGAGTFTVQSTKESYNEFCSTVPDQGKLIVSGFIPDDDVMKLKFNKLSPLDIGTTFPFQVGLCYSTLHRSYFLQNKSLEFTFY